MKYLKKFENIKYNIGDYVEIQMFKPDNITKFNDYAKIIHINTEEDVKNDFSLYEVIFDDGEESGLDEEDISRKVEPWEMEMIINSKKYNL